jgi:hypothetical protein
MADSGGDVVEEDPADQDSWAAAAASARASLTGALASIPTPEQEHPPRQGEGQEEGQGQGQGEGEGWDEAGLSFTSHSAYSAPTPPFSSAAGPAGGRVQHTGTWSRGCHTGTGSRGSSLPPSGLEAQALSSAQEPPLPISGASGGGPLLGHASLASNSDFPESVVRRQRKAFAPPCALARSLSCPRRMEGLSCSAVLLSVLCLRRCLHPRPARFWRFSSASLCTSTSAPLPQHLFL